MDEHSTQLLSYQTSVSSLRLQFVEFSVSRRCCVEGGDSNSRCGQLSRPLGAALVLVLIVSLMIIVRSMMLAQKAAFDSESEVIIRLEEDLGAPVRVVRFTGFSPYKHVDMIELPPRTYTDADFRRVVDSLNLLPHCDEVEVANAGLTQEEIRTLKGMLPRNVILCDGAFFIDESGSHPLKWQRVDPP